MTSNDEQKRPRSFITKFTIVYFVAGFIGLVLAFFDNPGFAAYTAVYWLTLGLGLALVSYGNDHPGERLAKTSKVVGWIWIVMFMLMASIVNNPAYQ